MLVIADSEKAAGLAGIMGGFETEITDTTTTVVLESADFYGPCIRRTARACGLSSEASGRLNVVLIAKLLLKPSTEQLNYFKKWVLALFAKEL